MKAGGIALPLYLALAVGAVPAAWSAAAAAVEPEEQEAGAGEPAPPAIYKWIDEHGIAHYTTDIERIPEELRDRVGSLGAPDRALGRAPADLETPAGPGSSGASTGDGERWAVRDSGFESPRDAGDTRDEYGEAPAPEPGEEDAFASQKEQQDRRSQLEDLDRRIASLQTDIAASEEALKTLISLPAPEGGGSIPMADDPEFREIAGRLPGLLANLRALQDERAKLEAP